MLPSTLPLRATPTPDPVESLRDRPDCGRPKSLASAIEPLLVGTRQAAEVCGVSEASWYRLKAAGRTPAPVKVGSRTLYRVADVKLWVALGCPDRKTFEARKDAGQIWK
jgi:predicted DNA-binding transcriptional regulator AlpA